MWVLLDPKTEKIKVVSPYSYSFNNPIYFIDKDGELPIGYIYYEVRGVLPLLAELGITTSFNMGFYFEWGDNFEVGVGVSSSLGLSVGKGLFAGWNVGVNWQADDIDQLNEWGANIGGAYAVPGIGSASIEGNFAIAGWNEKVKSGASVGLPLGSRFGCIGLGYCGFSEGSYTKIWKGKSVTAAMWSAFSPILNKIDQAIEMVSKQGGSQTLIYNLQQERANLCVKIDKTAKALDVVHKKMKEEYNKLSDKEKKDSKVNTTTWTQIAQLIAQVIANGGTVTAK